MRTRFAPSPTGPLHLGHAYAALFARDLARAADGTFLLRIEDIDQGRARARWEHAIHTDLAWLGIEWTRPVMRQSDRMAAYHEALTRLWRMQVLYPCTCRRRDIRAALSAPQEGASLHGPDGLIYPGTCRHNSLRDGPMPEDGTLRLDMNAALDRLAKTTIGFAETGPFRDRLDTERDIEAMLRGIGDVVLSRRDMGTSYHLSVVIDDAAQGITHVTRGVDLAEATFIHVVLQALLGLPPPLYQHHDLVRDDSGKRLAKRDDARAISTYRDAGMTPAQVLDLLPPLPDAQAMGAMISVSSPSVTDV